MKHRLVELVQSVEKAAPLRLDIVNRSQSVDLPEDLKIGRCADFCSFRNEFLGPDGIGRQGCSGCYATEIEEGELSADTGERYAVERGIPRLFSQSTSEFLQKNKKSFSLEWKYSRDDERNW